MRAGSPGTSEFYEGMARTLPAARWKRMRVGLMTARLRMLPEFLVVGGMKCGSTSLHRYLKGHPRIAAPLQKEIAFFSNYHAYGSNWYRAHFPLRCRARLARGRLLTGEATPSYVFFPWVPALVADLIPEARCIALLRNPADRAISHYWHNVAGGSETRPFEEACHADIENLRQREEAARSGRQPHRSRFQGSYLSRGLYADQLRAWLAFFPREQLCILNSEEFFREPAPAMARVFEFLGLPPHRAAAYRHFNPRKIAARRTLQRGPLIEFFRPHNERLYDLLDARFDWDS